MDGFKNKFMENYTLCARCLERLGETTAAFVLLVLEVLPLALHLVVEFQLYVALGILESEFLI